jgi:hypothetical protein
MLGVSSVTCGAMADDEGGRRAEQLAQGQRDDLVFRAQPGTPAPGGGPERGRRWCAVALAKGSGDPR